MNRLHFGHLLILLTFSMNVWSLEIVKELNSTLEELNQDNCGSVLKNLEVRLENIKPLNYKSEIRETGHGPLLQEIWFGKVSLHERLRSFHRSGGFVENCSRAARGALRAIRTVEDYISENQLRTETNKLNFPDNAFGKNNIHVRRHPDFSGLDLVKDLKSGDIILSKGNAYTSSAIANLGEFDTQFSHMSIVYKDEKRRLWTVEAHIEVGSFVRSLKDHIEDKNSRTMIFRFDDEEIASRAAKFIFNKVFKESALNGNIPYDFGFNQEDPSQLFCSEVISHAFEHVSRGRIHLPMFKSRLNARKPQLVKTLGIKAVESFIPADIEVDPRFRMIAEWSDANKINDGLQKDAILQAVFRWNNDLKYELQQGTGKKDFLARNIAWPVRRIPLLGIIFKNKFPANMSRDLIGYFGVIEGIGELLQNELKAHDKQSLIKRGIPLMKEEKYKVLEKYRQKDLKQDKPLLHRMFRPSSRLNVKR